MRRPDSRTTTITRTAVRETGVFRHHDGPIVGSSETLQTSWHYGDEGLKENRN